MENHENANRNETNENKHLHRTGTLRKAYEFFINNNHENTRYKYKNNMINTTKYNIFTFLPKALLFQFMRLANIYFLIIAIIQCIEVISPLSPSTAIAPIAFVLAVSIIREGYEDYIRHKYDTALNSEPALAYRDGEWVESKSGTLKVGELVIVKENDPFPADLILLDSNLKEGKALIETGTLDGEKTLKNKMSCKETSGYFNNGGYWRKDKFLFSGKCISDYPNSELYKLEGNMDITLTDNNTMKLSIDGKQLLLKGALLKNTEWVIGFVVYTGHNTKLILNSKKPRMKFSRVEMLMSRLLITILILQSCFCILCAAINSVYYKVYVQFNPYLPGLDVGIIIDPLISYFTYLLLLNTMIPISLIITLEIAKLIQGYFISVDVDMYSHVRKKFVKAGSISLNEELGQVNFIFSDKTGTLTCNKMMFKYCVIGDVCYEYVRNPDQKLQQTSGTEEEKKIRAEKDIKTFGPKYFEKFTNTQTAAINKTKYENFFIPSEYNPQTQLNMQNESTILEEYWKALSLCHECTVEDKNDKIEYTGMSPDDIELVKSACAQGFEYKKSDSNTSKIVNIAGRDREFTLLNLIEFNSDRKRASVIIKEGDMIKLYIKGADTEIKKKLHKNSKKEFIQQSDDYVEFFSNKGFRTLFVAMKVIDPKEYEIWNEKYYQASIDLENRKKRIDEVYEEIESGVYLIGATIVEDKLQDEVPETIRDFRLAGIKVWMLTGDKMDTAYNIGLSCNLINKDLKIFKLAGEKGHKLDDLVRDYNGFVERHAGQVRPPYSILVDAVALTMILKTQGSTVTFLKIAYDAVAVICCRVSPLQKAEVVKAVKEYDKAAVTLSVGDGGNDVSMIMEAHIGIGVYGEEGMRAVQSSDYAIGEFKMLRRLLMYHGRTNNIRISDMILYFFFKNFVFTITHFYYAFYNNVSGQTIIDDWFISLYNMIFTAFPLGARAVSDHDVKPTDGKIIYKMMPFLYAENRDRPIFTKTSFILELFRGTMYGIINFFLLVFTLGVASVNSQGDWSDLWYFSVNCFTNIVFIVSIRLIILQRYHTALSAIIMGILSWALYFLFVIWVQYSDQFNSYASMGVAFFSGKLYFNWLLICVTTAMIDLLTKSIDVLFNSKLSGTLMILRKQRGTLENNVDLPEEITKLLNLYDIYDAKSGGAGANNNEENNRLKGANIQDLAVVDRVNIEQPPHLRNNVITNI